eukprot:m.141742 g.141742  ORF g.141742 m.141742 type:complete len:185 (-) comp14861_c0_seq2:2044-2598(-)
MGCFESKPGVDTELMYHCYILDETQTPRAEGKLIIKKEVIHWKATTYLEGNPYVQCEWGIRDLRKYGHKDRIFSIEAGSRCTQSGDFQFKLSDARQATTAFRALQTRTRNLGSRPEETNTVPPEERVTYTELDLGEDEKKENKARKRKKKKAQEKSEEHERTAYAEIDFDKTAELSQSDASLGI